MAVMDNLPEWYKAQYKVLYDKYMSMSGASGAVAPANSLTGGVNEPVVDNPLHNDTRSEPPVVAPKALPHHSEPRKPEPMVKQELMPPGKVERNIVEDEFEKGVPVPRG